MHSKNKADSAALASDATVAVKQHRRNSKKKKHPKLKKIIIAMLLIFLVAIIAVFGYVYSIISKAPKIEPANINALLSESTKIYDDKENELDTVFASSNRDTVNIKEMPEHLKNAFIALEDKSFRTHHGFNIIRMFGAIKDSIFSGGKISGTSTITQQLARNLYLPDQQFDRTISRKVLEAYYAVQLEKYLSKDEILQAYLNYIYLGYSSYGVQTASKAYFSKNVGELTIAQSAALAALPQSPSKYELVQFIEGGTAAEYKDVLLSETSDGVFIFNDISKSRREICLKLMKEQGYINEAEYKEAINTSLKDMLAPDYNKYNTKSAYFADYIIREVIENLQKEKDWDYDTAWNAVYNGGLKIYSTMDSQAQQTVLEQFANPKNYPGVSPNYDSNGNIISRTGQVLLYAYDNYFDADGNFILPAGNAEIRKDGSMLIYYGKDLNIYTTEVQGKTDYSLEFKNMYSFDESGILYSIQGGFINIPQEFKTIDKENNLIISADFLKAKENKGFMVMNEDGSVTIPPSSYSLKPRTIQPQAAMTIIENSTGNIKAMVGGRNTSGRKILNRAVDTPRQPGSSIKPLGVYAPALQQSAEEAAVGNKHKFTDFGIDKQGTKLYGDYLTAGSIVVDEKTVINGQVWPYNFSRTYSGPHTMRTAIRDSLNTCAVKVWMQVGVDYSLNMLKKFGITTLVEEGDANDRNAAALALGGMTRGTTTLEMASAYTVFPNNGVRYDTRSYTKVLDNQGKVLLENKAKSHEVLDPGVAWIMADMLSGVVNSAAANYAQIPGVFVGGKTGTTNDFFDDWFNGFTPNYTASLWIGNDYGISLSEHSIIATYMWGNIMRNIENAYGGSRAAAPSNVISYNGEYFISGTQSGVKSLSDIKSKEVLICEESGYLATPDCKHTKKKVIDIYSDEEEPKYYCHIHNSNPEKYPISPDETWVKPKEEPKKEDEKENPEDNTDAGKEKTP
ncbi:MAG: transglycosylase domain-containing protein [Eubacterium sp.]|nr:transglycosylase domain-containing protein [Eubacterium sp.]